MADGRASNRGQASFRLPGPGAGAVEQLVPFEELARWRPPAELLGLANAQLVPPPAVPGQGVGDSSLNT